MTSSGNNELSPELRESLRMLSLETQPPRDLEASVTATLKDEGLIRPRSRIYLRRSVAIAAIAASALFLAIALVFLIPPPSVKTDVDSYAHFYLLLLHDPVSEIGPDSDEETARRVSEYATWAAELSSSGHLVAAGKLEDAGQLLTRIPDESQTTRTGHVEGGWYVSGYFLINADGYEQAVALAQQGPHLKYGGRIEVRPIEEH